MTRIKIKKPLIILTYLFILINIISFFHAYKFTHFELNNNPQTNSPSKLSIGKKIKTLIMGIDNPRPENDKKPNHSFETIIIKSDKKLETWLIKPEIAKGTIILFHGYRGNKSNMLDKAEIFMQMGYNTLLVDFLGSGGSEGNQTTIGVKEAEQVKDVFNYLKEQNQNNIILFGTSMGAVAIMKAINDYDIRPNAIILECPFGTMLETIKARFKIMKVPPFPMAYFLCFWGGIQNGFNAFDHNPIEYAKSINTPTLLLYGEKDPKVSNKETNQIYKNLKGEKQLKTFPNAAHENYLIKYKTEWKESIDSFLNKNYLIKDY